MKKLIIVTIVSIFFIGCSDKDTSPSSTTDKVASSSFLGIEWVKIPAGEFQMGSNNGDNNEKPVHTVYLDTYYISKHEVTFAQYDAFCETTGRSKPRDEGGWGRGNMPVVNVSWEDAVAFCKWYSKKTDKNVHLPTEAQWEKACRAGSSDKRYGILDDIAWYKDNCGNKTHPVGQKKPNAYGLYDMLGNVWEWCSDWYGKNYYSKSPSRNPLGPSSGRFRVFRGCSVINSAKHKQVRAAYRDYGKLNNVFWYVGLRLAMD